MQAAAERKRLAERTEKTDSKKFKPTMTQAQAHAKTIEACKKEEKKSSGKKKSLGKGSKANAKAKVLWQKNSSRNRAHTRKKGNSCDGKRKSKAATMFAVVVVVAAALHIIYEPKSMG